MTSSAIASPSIEGSTVDDDADAITRIDALGVEARRVRSRRSQGHPLTPEDQRHLADLEPRVDHCWELLRRHRSRRYFGPDPDAGRAGSGERPRHGSHPRAERGRG